MELAFRPSRPMEPSDGKCPDEEDEGGGGERGFAEGKAVLADPRDDSDAECSNEPAPAVDVDA